MERKIIEYLWQIIDDIDTASDLAKGNDVAYRKMVDKLQKKRWKTGITTNGYKLDFTKMKAPDIGNYYLQKADVKATVSRPVMLVMLRNMSALSFTLTDNFLYRGRCSKRVYEMVSNTHKCIVTFQLTELSFIVTIRGNVFRDGYWTELNYVKVNTKANEIF